MRRQALPGVKNCYVVALHGASWSGREVEELYLLAHRIGRMLGRRHFGDAECYSLTYNAARTRRRPWPHVHVLIARSVSEKRRNMVFMMLKNVLRWRRWPWLRWLSDRSRSLTSFPQSARS